MQFSKPKTLINYITLHLLLFFFLHVYFELFSLMLCHTIYIN